MKLIIVLGLNGILMAKTSINIEMNTKEGLA